jgi:hypothetical protein
LNFRVKGSSAAFTGRHIEINNVLAVVIPFSRQNLAWEVTMDRKEPKDLEKLGAGLA